MLFYFWMGGYHPSKNDFENYLLKNINFETASSSRHDFDCIYEGNGKKYFKLNLQNKIFKIKI